MVILGHFFGQKYLEGAITSEGAPNRQKERRKKNNSEAPNLEQVGLGQLKCYCAGDALHSDCGLRYALYTLHLCFNRLIY